MKILLTGARAPIAADLIRALTQVGHEVWACDSLRFPLGAASSDLRGYIRVPAPRTEFPAFAVALRETCTRFSIETILPTSEEIFWLAQAIPLLPAKVDVRISPLPVLASLHHKARFAALADRLGYGAPENHLLRHPNDLSQLSDPGKFVFKPVYSRFATHTLIGPTARQLSKINPTPEQAWLAQTRVYGRELCAYNVASNGQLLFHVAYEPLFRFGLGASTYFAPVNSSAVRQMCEAFIAATDFTGQISFDVIATSTGRLVALECNPRGTSGVHLAAQNPSALAAALLGKNLSAPIKSPAPRMLFLPLLLHHPGAWLRFRERAQLRVARDALTAAGISRFAQFCALTELSWQATRRGLSLAATSTADFEWNGEPAHASG